MVLGCRCGKSTLRGAALFLERSPQALSNLDRVNWFVIVNPVAGSHRAQFQWCLLEEKLQKLGISFVAYLTKGKGDACNQAMIAFQQNFRNFIVVGGDGTHHEFVNGIMGLTNDERRLVRYTLFPAGTGNDFARHFRLPGKIEPWLTYLNCATDTPIDVGRIDMTNQSSIYFINEAGLGLAASVVKRLSDKSTSARSNLKYLIEAIKTIFSFEGIRIRLSVGASKEELYLWNLTVANCRFLGCGFQLAPGASPADGLLDTSIISKTGRWQVISDILYFFNGKIKKLHYITCHQSSSVLVEPLSDSEVLIEVDGEIRGSLPAEFFVMEQAINFYIPLNYLK
jgi:YegS/Rv2252/BmrU family lipid kinase